MYIHMHIHKYMHIYEHMYTHMHKHMHIHTPTQMHTLFLYLLTPYVLVLCTAILCVLIPCRHMLYIVYLNTPTPNALTHHADTLHPLRSCALVLHGISLCVHLPFTVSHHVLIPCTLVLLPVLSACACPGLL